jgi:two-component system, LytTR family, sensor kinase
MKLHIKKYSLMVLVGIIISLLINSVVPLNNPDHSGVFDVLLSIVLTIAIWEGNILIDGWMNKWYPWQKNTIKRLLIHFPVSLIFCVLIIILAMLAYNRFVCHIQNEFRSTVFISSLVIGTLFSIILLTAEISVQFFIQWKRSMLEVEKYKNESLQAQLQNLKNQINPHFLFNNLSVLSSLVYKDQDKAVNFINQLSKVYRYLLDNHNNELITLENELTFIKSYNYLLQIRFDKNIVFNIDIEDKYLNRLIPPMALQMLIENAIKHNEISKELPLTIDISVTDEHLTVKNNLQLRASYEQSSKTGLQNIKDRYRHFSDREIEIIKNNHSFIVKIPLLHS